jgi:hypothetical protein
MRKRKINLVESSTLSSLDKMRLFDEGTRRENLKACSTTKLLDYYEICLDYALARARAGIEGELDRRDMREFIVPSHHLLRPTPKIFTEEVARAIVDAHGDINKILSLASKSFSHGSVMITAYVIAVAADEKSLAHEIDFYIKSIGTYSSYMRSFVEQCIANPEIITQLNKLLTEMEAYGSW